jgi:hypothetical protein
MYRKGLWAIAACVLLIARLASAQTFGQITGIVTDSTGGVLPGATVTVTNTQTAATVTQQANNAGNYVFPNLLPGIYTVKVDMDGFRSALRNNLELQVAQTARVDFKLELGTISETIQAVGTAPMLNTEDTVIGTVIDNKRILELPLNGRNFLKMVELTPNVSASFTTNSVGSSGPRQGGDRSQQQISISGGRREWNYFTLDGVNNTDVNFNSYIFLPSIDALQEFKVQTGVYSAELGRELGQVSVTTKAGTNNYHGSVFEFIRNDALDALPYAFAGVVPQKSPFKWNQYGFTLGGPLQIPGVINGKDKLFFMGNYEGFRLRNQRQTVFSVPTVAMRNGDFSGISTVIRDPQTGLPFPGNVIPQNRISPISQKFLNYYPTPNQPTSGIVNNYLSVNQNYTDKDQITSRIDYTESPKSTWYGRYSWTSESLYNGGLYLNGSKVNTHAHQGVVDNARVLSTTLVNELRFGFNSFFNHSGGELNNVRDPIAEVGLQLPTVIPADAWGTPSIGITGFSGFGDNSESPFINTNKNWQVVDNLSWTHGAHFLKFGAEFRLDHYNQDGNQFARGSAGFANNIATGYAFADYLLGDLATWSYASGLATARLHAISQAYYAADTWKLGSKLTANIGLRYELTPPWTDSLHRQIVAQIPLSTFSQIPPDPAHPQVADLKLHPVLVRAGTGDFYQDAGIRFSPDIQVARDGRLGTDRLIQVDHSNIAPRLGLSWSPTPNTVLRGGAGRFFVQDIGNIVFDKNRNLNGRLTVQSTSTNLISTWSDPFNFGGGNPCNTPAGVLCVVRPLVLTDQVDRKTPYVDQYELSAERQLDANTSVEVSFLGTEGHKLQRWVNLANQPVPGTAPVADRSPFPEFGLFQGAANVGYSHYRSLGIKLTRRYTAGLTVLGAYTFSKSTDNGSGIRVLGTDPLNPQNSYCFACEDGLSVFDQRHRFVTSVVYDLPFGAGRKFATDGPLRNVVGGWKVTSVVTLGTGFPLTVGGEDTANIGNCCRPNRDFSISTKLDNPTIDQWFNTAAYSRAPNGTFGTAGRSEIIGPGIENWDFSLSKEFHFAKSPYLEFRMEAFNFLNHPNWGDPTTGITSAAFGRISSTRTDMRQLQFGLKLVF